ncbi:uncharacterized protein EV420DRAFT_496768 [Desarmillaria tabescens]|uniref:Uncharacterized protein n=1 Tax=Armillaria tabescens TaxID=1929756 RepID=A0AA39KAA3_ARMTA|nr:uncharacterized protein EV420DRAFT_496768 [Desarmillaria tabescens]KAK0457476.1 hypothetical protein EV420DRAFT_496768 [Desarmillaria tabescens]
MLTATDTSISLTADSSDIILRVDLDLALPDSDTSFSDLVLPRSQRAVAMSSLLLSIPPEILPKAIRSLTTWRLQESRSALPNTKLLVQMAEALDSTQPGRRIKWISREYYKELEWERGREENARSCITGVDDTANDGPHDIENVQKGTPSRHGLFSSQLRRGCSVCHIPQAGLSVTSIPTIKPVPTKTISTTTMPHKAIPTKVPITPTSTAKLNATAKSKRRRAIADSENIPPSQAQTQPRRRPAAGKSRMPAPRVFGLHNA